MKFRVEPDLKYCPRCHDEYRADIEKCASCSVELLTGRMILELEEQKKAQMANRSMEIQEHEELVDIRKGSVMEMKQVQSMLAREGFPTQLGADNQSCGKGCCGPEVLLRARRTDLEEIFKLFQNDYVESTALNEHDISLVQAAFNPDANQATCPACGYSFSKQSDTCPDCGLCF